MIDIFTKKLSPGSLRALLLAICCTGPSHGAVILSIYESGGRTHFKFDGGSLDLGPDQVSVPLTTSTTANQISAVGATGSVGIDRISTGLPSQGAYYTFPSTGYTLDSSGWFGSNNLANQPATYEGGAWALSAGSDPNITVTNATASPFAAFFTSSAVIDGHQSIAGDLSSHGFLVGDTRTITITASGDTYTINVIPEPSTMVIGGIGALLLLRRKRTQV